MKKFLCYDTNDAASGKINVSANGVLKPNSTVPSTNGASYQHLVTDGDGNTKWEDRLAYADVVETDIAGMEVTVTSRLTNGDDIDMTLHVGDVWQVELSGQVSSSYTLTVEGLEDGTLVLGDNWSTNSWNLGFGVVQSANNNAKFKVNSGLASNLDIASAKFTCISGSITEEIVKTIDEKYIPTLAFLDKNNPTGTGSFSVGCETTARGDNAHAEGYYTKALGSCSHAEGANTEASGSCSHAEGGGTHALATYSHAEGFSTIAYSESQHVQGRWNAKDTTKQYAHIVGNGTDNENRCNAHTIDWSGNAWFAGTVEGTAMIVKSSTSGSSKRFKITVDDSGTISATEVTS